MKRKLNNPFKFIHRCRFGLITIITLIGIIVVVGLQAHNAYAESANGHCDTQDYERNIQKGGQVAANAQAQYDKCVQDFLTSHGITDPNIDVTPVPSGVAELPPATHVSVPPSLGGSGSFGNVQDLVTKVVSILSWTVGVASVIGVLVGALLYVISAGDPSKTRIAKDAILYSVVALIIALLSLAIVTFVIGKVN